jgi:hypothetical protein
MRRIFALATALLGMLAITAVAIAGQAGPSPSGQTQVMDAAHSPNKASKKKKPVGTNVTITISLSKTDGSKPSPTTHTTVTLPAGMQLNYTKFPQCDQNKLAAQGPKGCPGKSKVGAGSIKANAQPVVTDPVGGTVTAFNGKNKTYLLYVVPELSSPLIIPGKLKGTKKNPILDFAVPLVPTLPGQPNATLTYFQVKTGKKKIKKGGKTYWYIANPTKCPSGGWPWKLAFTYENGETLTPTDNATCKK